MSYIQATLGGKEQGLKFNQLSIEVFTSNINYEAIDTSSIYAIFFAGLTGNYYAKRKDIDFTFENVCDWVDELFENDRKKIEEVCEVFAQTNAYKEWVQEFSKKVRLATEAKDPAVLKAKKKAK